MPASFGDVPNFTFSKVVKLLLDSDIALEHDKLTLCRIKRGLPGNEPEYFYQVDCEDEKFKFSCLYKEAEISRAIDKFLGIYGHLNSK